MSAVHRGWVIWGWGWGILIDHFYVSLNCNDTLLQWVVRVAAVLYDKSIKQLWRLSGETATGETFKQFNSLENWQIGGQNKCNWMNLQMWQLLQGYCTSVTIESFKGLQLEPMYTVWSFTVQSTLSYNRE